MKYRTIIPSNNFPCDVEFVKAQLRITHDSHDDYLASLIGAATDWACAFTGRQINFATLEAYTFYSNHRTFVIERGPAVAITRFEYMNDHHVMVPIPETAYTLAPDDWGVTICMNDDFVYISPALARHNAIQIEFTAGYTIFPELIRNAVALKAAHMYAQPDDGVDEKTSISENLLKSIRCAMV